MAVKCTNCGGSHPKWDCTKPQKESTAARKDVLTNGDRSVNASAFVKRSSPGSGLDQIGGGDDKGKQTAIAGAQSLPVDTPPKPKIGRPKTNFDRTEYQKLYMRDKATIKRLGLNCTVKEWREKK